MSRAFLRWTGLVLLSGLLAGCAGRYLLDNQVQSFTSLTAVPSPSTYRFERLPSQQAPAQAQMEALADAALQKAGMRRDDAHPRYSVQVSGRLQRVVSPWASPWDGWGWGAGFHHHHGLGLGFMGPFPRMESPWYEREVSLIIRELPSNRVVYETRALNAGPWTDSGAVFPAIFDASLQGFPTPPPGPRVVNIQLPR